MFIINNITYVKAIPVPASNKIKYLYDIFIDAPGREARATHSEAQYASNLALAC